MTYYEATANGKAIVNKFSEQLRGYGYTDVIFEKYPHKTESGYRLSNSICIYFWSTSYGYMLSISDKNEHWRPDETCDFDTFISICEKILPFAKNTSILEADYTQAFGDYLKQQGISNAKASLPQINEAFANICFHNAQYRIFLHRMNVNATLNKTLKELDDYDEELSDKPDEEIYGHLKSEIAKTIEHSNLLGMYSYETIFEWDCIGLSIYNQLHSYNLYITPSLFYDELGYQIATIVNCFIRQIKNHTTDLLTDLCGCNFHKHRQSDDGFTAIVCERLDLFTIVAWSEDLADGSAAKTSLLSSKPAFDNMNGSDFEEFCAMLLRYNGFANVTLTQSSGDQGVDIIAYKDSIKYGIQCKCYTADVGNKAVQEILAGRTFYNCDVGVVLTNRYFTKAAIELAKKSRIHLWDRDKLIQLVNAMSMP